MSAENTFPNQNDPGVDATLKRHGGLSYLEIPATNVEASENFYHHVLGWNTEAGKVSDPANLLIGRFITARPASQHPGMVPFFYITNIRQAVQTALAHGGQEIKPLYPEGHLSVAVIRDPAGNIFGLWEDAATD
jgi:hypothetical protein